ncbi:MAG: hypothetical protein E7373_06775 [Clostridiales bacterium]|nr:hypothetical protein [Clostridiales bacterium]
MKINKKRLLTIIFVSVLLLSLFAIGCKNKNGEEVIKGVLYKINVCDEQLDVLLGSSCVLDVEYNKVAGVNLQFSSENNEIATIDEYGIITAHSVGETNIKVTYGNKTAQCLVRVYVDDYKPILFLPQVQQDSVNVFKDSSLNLNGKVLFAGNTYDDVSIEYTLSDKTVGTIVDGVFTALKVGKTTVTAQATWRGMAGETMYKEFSIAVISDVQLYVNDGQSGRLLMYTQEDEPVSFKVGGTDNDIAIDKEQIIVDFVMGENLLSFDKTAQTLKSKGISGEAKILLSYTDRDGEFYETLISVSIRPTIREYGETVTGFSAIDGNVVIGKAFAEILGSPVVEAYDKNGEALEVKNGNVYGIETSSTGKTCTTITICSRSIGYTINLEGYTRIIDEASDLSIFGVYNSTAAKFGDAQYQDGYYVLGNNIDASNYVHPATGNHLGGTNAVGLYGCLGKQKIGLTGTFDGNGYTIHNLSLTRYGLFGFVLGGTIKNVGFENVLFVGPNTGWDGGGQTTFAQYIAGGTLENVYVHAEKLSLNPNLQALLLCDTHATIMTNCMFVLDEDVSLRSNMTGSYGSLGSMWGYYGYPNKGSDAYANVYVISPTPISYVPNTSANGDNSYTVDAENRLLDDGSKNRVRKGVIRYDSFEDMRNNKNYFSDDQLPKNGYFTFYNDYWDMSSGIPVWKTLKDKTGKWESNNENYENFPEGWI